MTKYYRTIKDLPAYSVGAILKKEDGESEYRPISDVWEKIDGILQSTHTSVRVVEEATDFYERVYDITVLGKVSYVVKEKAIAAYNKLYKDGE